MRIAVVDDDYTARTLLSEFLEDEGYDVVAIRDPNMLESIENCAAIIMDVMIGHDRYAGIDYVLEQRDSERISDEVQVVFISNFGRDSTEIRNRLQRVGDYAWLDKPIDLPELGDILRRLVSRTGE
jgi:DNA-binding response OmpR family regulator